MSVRMSCISVAPTSPLRAGAWEGCTRATEKRIGPSQPRIFSIHSHSCRMSHALHPGACQVHLQCRRDAPAGRERRKTAAALGGASPWARGKNHTRPSGQQRGGRLGLGRLEYGGRRAERGLCVQCRAVAAPSSAPPFGALSLSLPFGEINLDFIASALGYAMGAGSLLLFAPILINILKAKSSKGMSVTTWVLQLTAFAGSTLYNLSKGHPFSTFAESACLGVQSLIILLLILYYQDRLDGRVLAGVAAFIAVCALALWGLPPAAWTPVQVLSSAIGVGALLPQILLNFRQGSTGEWSAITAGLSTAGNGLRVFTTVQLTGDPVLMVGFTAGFLVNLTLFLQILYYSAKGDDAAPAAAAAQQEQKESS